jgi:opacity protein-like surface antigen
MVRKIAYATALICANLGQVSANAPHQPKAIQPYVGVAGGIEFTRGTRSESLQNSNPVDKATFTANKGFSDNNINLSIFGGLTWNIPSSSFFIGPEIYWGRFNGESLNNAFVLDVPNGANRTIETLISKRYSFGFLVKPGIILTKDYRAYLLVGVDISRFRNSTFYTPRSVAAITGGASPDIPPYTLSTSRWMKAFLWGLGFEREFSCHRLGAEFRYMQYKTFSAAYNVNTGLVPPDQADSLNNIYKPKSYQLMLKYTYIL